MTKALIAFAVALSAVTANAEPPEAPARGFTGRDLFGLQVATDPQIRSDGAVVAYTRVSHDVMTDRARPSIWLAANTDVAVERAARLGDGWMIGPHSAIDELEGQVELCRRAWIGANKTGAPGLPIIRETFVAKSREEAIEKARPCLEQLYRGLYIKWKQNEAMNDPSELRWAFDKLAKGRFILGSPAECIDQIHQYEERLGVSYMLPRFDWTPGLPQEEILASMRLFGEKVIQKL